MKNKLSALSRIIHWFSALLILALFVSGWFMVDLDYYSPWYNTLPEWHITGGVVLMLLWLIVILRLFLPKKPLSPLNHKPIEAKLAVFVQCLFYPLVFAIVVCGYLLLTADGISKEVFAYLKLPAFSHFSANQIDTIGWLHKYLSYLLMVLVMLHVLGALKHHFIDKDDTLKRML